jgi:hypothetical protein
MKFGSLREGKVRSGKLMKISRIMIFCLVVSVAYPQMAGAKLSITPEGLGFVEGTLDFCAKADPDSAAKYKERGKAFVGDATKEELEKARSSSEYKDSYDSTTGKFEKVPKEDAVKACKAFLEGK